MNIISLWTRFICFSFAILLTSGFTTSKEENGPPGLKKTGSALLFEALTKTESMRANFEHEQISNSGKTVVFKGSIVFRRPDRLKWQVKEPYNQLQLVRGNQFLVYDPDLEQVIVKELDSTFSSTPAGLLFASGPEARDFLRERYEIYEAPNKDSLNWVLALPRFGDKEGSSALEVGLTDKAEIERLITTDIFGKSSTIIFSNVSTNFLVKDSEFIPVIPEGVEYIEN